MMQRIIYAAVLLLIVQVGLVVALNRGYNKLEVKTPDITFLDFAPSEINSIEITDSENHQLVLDKKNSSWLISTRFSAPAETALIKKFLDTLANANKGFAVATSSGAAVRFKTAETNFESHILLKKGDEIVGDFYLGSSAGMRRSHVRKAGELEIYALPVSSFEVEADADKWLDKNAFKVDKDTLKSLSIADIELTKKDDGWFVAGIDAKKVKYEEVEKLVNAITDLNVQSILDPEEVKALFENDPDFQFTLSTVGKEAIQYFFVKQEDFSVLKISDIELYFKVFNWQLKDLQEFKKEKLVHTEDEAAPTEPGDTNN